MRVSSIALAMLAPLTMAHGPKQRWDGGKPATPEGVVTGRFAYEFEGETFEGYVAHPSNPIGLLPGAMVFHQWYGEGEVEQWRAEQLAHTGFVAFAVDMYGQGQRATSREEAVALVGPARGDAARYHRLLARLFEVFIDNYPVDPTKISVSGYCFGGQAVLEIVRRGYPGVVAAAAFHPSTTNLTATIPPTMTENVQIHYPELEPAGDEGLAFFEEELRYGEAMGWTTFKYGGASHGFTDPTNAVYDAKQSRLSHEYYHALHYELGLVEHKDSHYDTVGLACDPSRPNMCGDYSCTCSASSRRHLLFSTAPSVCTCA
uniref:Dienelactone hydrolase domain-containing protein n=1 Tax=Chrysotila carterae TaxID=13221 RepID=A0A6T0C0P3_CHRCT